MTYSSKAVANYFLELGDRDNIKISPMKIQKLVYYAHGWNLGFTGEPLINEQVECWRYGPVIDTLFHAFKQYGSDPITRPATSIRRVVITLEGKHKAKLRKFVPRIDKEDMCINLMDAVWESYGELSAVKLSNMTHETGEPWQRVYSENQGSLMKGTDIPLNYIRDYFSELINGGE